MGYYIHVGIEFGDGAAGRFDLGLTDGGLTVDNLTLKVRFVHPIEINDSQSTHSCGGEIGEKGRTKATCPDSQNSGSLELALTFDSDLGHDEMAGISTHLW